jgi:hypothetical protein
MNAGACPDIQNPFPFARFEVALDEGSFEGKSLGTARPLIPGVVVLSTAMIKGTFQGIFSLPPHFFATS